jgi:beta-lactam-binding protein with PASTA domain
VRACRAALEEAGFEHRTVETDSARRSGTFLGTSPPRGARAVPGQVVSILVSNGEDYVAPAPDPEPRWQDRQQQPDAPQQPADPPAPEPGPPPAAPEAPDPGQWQDGGGGDDGQGRPDDG